MNKDYEASIASAELILQKARLFELTEERIRTLVKSLSEMKSLRELVPFCVSCQRILDDNGYWRTAEIYMEKPSKSSFGQCLCPECYEEEIEELFDVIRKISK